MADSNKRSRGEGGEDVVRAKAQKWADEFAALEEDDDKYAYIELLAQSGKLEPMHIQFMQGVVGFDEDEEEDDEDSGSDEEEEDDDDAGGDDDDDE